MSKPLEKYSQKTITHYIKKALTIYEYFPWNQDYHEYFYNSLLEDLDIESHFTHSYLYGNLKPSTMFKSFEFKLIDVYDEDVKIGTKQFSNVLHRIMLDFYINHNNKQYEKWEF